MTARRRTLNITDETGRTLMPTDPQPSETAAIAKHLESMMSPPPVAPPAPDQADDAHASGIAAVLAKITKARTLLEQCHDRIERWVLDGADGLDGLMDSVESAGGDVTGAEDVARGLVSTKWEPPKHKQPLITAGDKVTIRPDCVDMHAASYDLAMEMAGKSGSDRVLTAETVLTVARVVGEGRARRFNTLVGLLPLAHIRRAKP